MSDFKRPAWTVIAVLAVLVLVAGPAAAQQKPNVLFILGDDIGGMQAGAHHRGIGIGETLNIDRLANEGAISVSTTYYAMPSCTPGRDAFFTRMYRPRMGMIPLQFPGSPSYLRPGTPAIA